MDNNKSHFRDNNTDYELFDHIDPPSADEAFCEKLLKDLISCVILF